MHSIRRCVIAAILVLGGIATAARAQDYPTRPVRFISDSAPGSAIDVTMRVIVDGISRVWGEDPEGGLGMLLEARTIAFDLGRFDDLFRATANITTALDLLGRKREAVEVARAGIEAARRADRRQQDRRLHGTVLPIAVLVNAMSQVRVTVTGTAEPDLPSSPAWLAADSQRDQQSLWVEARWNTM